ncbi:Bor/Iss family lipoprotein [Marinicellulosiphila megalodicopiae]|uniref:Bor/Iss family lipoprotein n=1 Tax=Marinicellulosiphila megalodicopiae TaxID=2724896 RepID=UPI003BB18960
MNILKLGLLATILISSSCSTIYFDNGNKTGHVVKKSIHHHAVFALVEVSAPLDLKGTCGDNKEWSSVKVETKFGTALLNSILTSAIRIPGSWSMNNTEISCASVSAE